MIFLLILLANGLFANQDQQASKYKKQLNWGEPLEYGQRWVIDFKPPKPTDTPTTYWQDFRLPTITCQSGARCLSGTGQSFINPLTGTVLGY